MNKISRSSLALAAISFLAPLGHAHAAWTEKVLFSFPGASRTPGSGGDLIMDSAGNLYGTTEYGGTNNLGVVFKLTAPTAGHTVWREKVLYNFTEAAGGMEPDGGMPRAGLVFDSAGNLYGTTSSGGKSNEGVVFRLTAPAAGKVVWRETVLHSFTGKNGDGSAPYAGLIFDAAGNLYGTTISGARNDHTGRVFKLSPVTGKPLWAETILYAFAGGAGVWPVSRLVFDAAGNLYGTTLSGGASNFGAVYKLAPPVGGGTAWTETVLHSFTGKNGDGDDPNAGLIFDAAGNLYGTAEGGGTNNVGVVFELSPPSGGGTSWTETVLTSFDASDGGLPMGGLPMGALTFDASGNLYGTTSFYALDAGTVFKLAPPAAGQTKWTETTLYDFKAKPDAGYPQANVIFDTAGNLYGSTLFGGTNDAGAIFKLKP